MVKSSILKRIEGMNEAFKYGDVDYIVHQLSDNVRWHLVGELVLQGKESVEKMLRPMQGEHIKEYRTKQMTVNGNRAIIEGVMSMPDKLGEEKQVAFCDIYTFEHADGGDVIDVTAYLIELSEKEVI